MEYELRDFHFHIPSEHKILGQRYIHNFYVSAFKFQTAWVFSRQRSNLELEIMAMNFFTIHVNLRGYKIHGIH